MYINSVIYRCETQYTCKALQDNVSATSLASTPLFQVRTKNVDTHYHYIRACFSQSSIESINLTSDGEMRDITYTYK